MRSSMLALIGPRVAALGLYGHTKWFAFLAALVVAAGAGLWYHTVKRDNYIERGITDAQALLAFTASYVGTYTDVMAGHNVPDAPVPATFRARALAKYNAGEGKYFRDRIAMVGIPGHEVSTRAEDSQLRERLVEMDSHQTPMRYSEVVELGGRATLRTVFPSIANNQSCVNCHNALPGQTHQWRVGDMMGAFVAERDIDLPLLEIRNSSLLVCFLSGCLVWLLATVFRKNQSLRKQSRLLGHMADTDPLTDCMNRRAFFDCVTREQSSATQESTDRLLVVFDLDHFKSINDNYGHAFGDQVLTGFANRVRGQIRSSDSFARIGGEEFALLLAGASSDHYAAIAERIVRSVESMEFYCGAQRIPVTVSAGAVLVPGGAMGWYERSVRLADAALYRAKELGRNQLVVHG